jgi:mycothiol synthase
MLRPNLDDLPALAPPEGYWIRTYRPGDAANWALVLSESFGHEFTAEYFERQMKRDNAFRPERMFFVECADGVAASASAWYQPRWGKDTGYVHFVGTRPSHAGKRLGYWVSLATLHQFVREGRTCAQLQTDDFRLAAIKTYLRLGFQPRLVHENQRERWRALFAKLGEAQALERFAVILDGPVAGPLPELPDEYDLSKLAVRRLWHPGRTPRRGPGGGTIDALGDESLYKASRLGTAGISVAEVRAAADKPFTLWFRGGAQPLEAGTAVRFCMRGQRPFGERPQLESAGKPAFAEIEAPAGVMLEPLVLGFRIGEGVLREGDLVQLHVGRQGGFRWTELAGKREFKVLLDTHPDEPQLRLPEPVVVCVLPLEPERLDVLLPGTPRADASFTAHVSVRDRFDNRVPLTGVAAVRFDGQNHSIALTDGLGRLPLSAPRAVARAYAMHPGVPGQFASNPSAPRPAPICNPQSAICNLYLGDLHCHDFLSEAEGYPDQVYTWARDDKRLDFVSVSVQSHGYHENDKWTIVKHLNERFLDEGSFVTFLGFEWQHSHYGDKVIHYLGGDQPYLPVDDGRYSTSAKLYEALRGSDALVISHHPGYPLDLHVPGTDWSAVETDVDRLAELWSMHGSSEGYDPADRPLRSVDSQNSVLNALKAGVRVGLVAGSDTHSARPCGSAREPLKYWGGLAAVWAESLTRRSIFEALWARRTYALTGARIVLEFSVNGSPMGSEIPPADEAQTVVEAHAPRDLAKVEIMRNGDVLHTASPGKPDCRLELSDRPDASATTFYHCRVTQEDGQLAVCSPVWVG